MKLVRYSALKGSRAWTIESTRSRMQIVRMIPQLSGWSWHRAGDSRVVKLGRWELVWSPIGVAMSPTAGLAAGEQH